MLCVENAIRGESGVGASSVSVKYVVPVDSDGRVLSSLIANVCVCV